MSKIPDQWAFVQDLEKLIAFARQTGFVLTLGGGWRSDVEAWINSLPHDCNLAAISPGGTMFRYETKVGGVGIRKSKHCERLAVDFNIFKDGKYLIEEEDFWKVEPLGIYWEALSPPMNRWGGHFQRKDTPHFERNI